ncbi:hypothetical protein P691DRAFT_766580 [Macrolepiota fuliginosa MF-IS2]|uniref:Nephrocystin 3-like N-terminal domain-containing protein n=1 Tax=Macrolepiota fuliginosa MF-IS2 TaxID=1400762 RepID=A0A9P6BV38_9AGAR|nr:hypothetical protein P691DRAFT_766580 [Macrolepiota fuliginosa MF-IS2]
MLLKFFGLLFGGGSTVPDPNLDEPQLPPDNIGSSSFLGAHDFVINQPIMADKAQTVNNIYTGKTVFETLLPFCSIGAMSDSSARDPPPRCHPRTRQSVRERLLIWPRSRQNKWKMKWLHGPVGVGKSAVAQTFAEDCQAGSCLGGAFFFSRLKGFDKPLQVIPTLAYQLAINLPGYKAALGQLLADDPAVLQKAIHIQFRKLIIEPFSMMPSNALQRPYVMILDGLDECEGESVQCEIIEMISEVTRLRSDLPLLWLICSRSESHLKMTFSRADFMINCGQEKLLIDRETKEDVGRYLRDGFQKIRVKYRDVITSEPWPGEWVLSRVERVASGLFVLASSALEYVQDPEYANPEGQLRSLLSFFEGGSQLASNPLTSLDLLYTHILSAVPDHALPIALQIIYVHVGRPHSFGHTPTMKDICDDLRLDENAVYSSLRKLHSVMRIPTPREFRLERLKFRHLSFLDFLENPIRSGKFCLSPDPPMPSNFLRTQPYYEVDLKLLNYLWAVADPLAPLEPASFPIDLRRRAKYPFRFENIYFLLGHGSKSCLTCVTFEIRKWNGHILSLGPQPTWVMGKSRTYQSVDWEEARRRGDTYRPSVGSVVGPLVAE